MEVWGKKRDQRIEKYFLKLGLVQSLNKTKTQYSVSEKVANL